ncbi:MAG TPA: phosphocholine cytidylyltransferase family protein [Methylomirabilota bacterium]|nr:phosphocholine cytidylyltransferase family protein [Methylomirabilota bacterium]
MIGALILSAGQGRRLLPLTATMPKCLLRVHQRTLLEWQLDALARCGIPHATVVTGFGSEHVEGLLAARTGAPRTQLIYNPFFRVSDNLVSCWMARGDMTGDIVLLNGDTLFEPAVLERLLAAPPRPVRLAIDHKEAYDADDMKVSLDADGRVRRVGKRLAPAIVGAESIGLMLFRGDGSALFREAIERALRRPDALHSWYLSVIDEMADHGHVWTESIQGLRWAEIDSPADIARALGVVERPANQPLGSTIARTS